MEINYIISNNFLSFICSGFFSYFMSQHVEKITDSTRNILAISTIIFHPYHKSIWTPDFFVLKFECLNVQTIQNISIQ